MLLTLFVLVVFGLAAAGVWFHGLWGNVVTLVNLLISALVATSYYEPVTLQVLDLTSPEYSYVADFLVLWGLFALTFGILRLICDLLSPHRLKFHPMTELIGRSITAVIIGYVLMMFTAMTVHTAPLQANPFNGAWTSSYASFLGMSPESQWLGFVRGQSQLGLKGGPVFDETGTWLDDQANRRRALEQQEGFLSR